LALLILAGLISLKRTKIGLKLLLSEPHPDIEGSLKRTKIGLKLRLVVLGERR